MSILFFCFILAIFMPFVKNMSKIYNFDLKFRKNAYNFSMFYFFNIKKPMYKKTKKAFTLVELIIVIAIIAILAVSAFLVLTKWIAKSRDSRRINDLATIRDALNIGSVESTTTLSEPDDKRTINFIDGTTKVISYQWDFGKDKISKADLKWDLKDPTDNDYYTYAIDYTKSNYALMAMLEWDSTSYVGKSVYAVDYANRKPRIEWSRLWVFVNSSTNSPAEKEGTADLDVASSTGYVAYLDSTTTINGDLQSFVVLRWGANSTLELIGYYPFMGDAKDKSGKDNDLWGTFSWVVGQIWSWASMVTAKALSGTNKLDTTKPFSIIFWVNNMSWNAIKIASWSTVAFAISGNSSNITFYASGSTKKVESTKAQSSSSSYVQIAMVVNPSDDKIYMYVNGSQVDSQTFPDDVTTTGYLTTIGGTSGNIDEVRLYQRSLSETEIKNFYDIEK